MADVSQTTRFIKPSNLNREGYESSQLVIENFADIILRCLKCFGLNLKAQVAAEEMEVATQKPTRKESTSLASLPSKRFADSLSFDLLLVTVFVCE